MPIINYLQRQSTTRIWLLALIISVVMSEIITGVMSLILQGKITYDYLLTGLVASLLVAGFVVAVLIIFLGKLQEDARQLHTITENLDKSEVRARQALMASHSALWDLDLTTWNIYFRCVPCDSLPSHTCGRGSRCSTPSAILTTY